MQQAKTFINNDIFTYDGDYVIGGFETTKTDGFKYADFAVAFEERVKKLISDYVKTCSELYLESGVVESPINQALKDCQRVIGDNLNISVENNDMESLCSAVINSDKAQTWLNNISNRVKNYPFTVASGFTGIHNASELLGDYSPEYQNAKEQTNETTFEMFIEQLSLIEL